MGMGPPPPVRDAGPMLEPTRPREIPDYKATKQEYDRAEFFVRLSGPDLGTVDLPVSLKKGGPFTQAVRVDIWERDPQMGDVKRTYTVYMSPGAKATYEAATADIRALSTRVTSWDPKVEQAKAAVARTAEARDEAAAGAKALGGITRAGRTAPRVDGATAVTVRDTVTNRDYRGYATDGAPRPLAKKGIERALGGAIGSVDVENRGRVRTIWLLQAQASELRGAVVTLDTLRAGRLAIDESW